MYLFGHLILFGTTVLMHDTIDGWRGDGWMDGWMDVWVINRVVILFKEPIFGHSKSDRRSPVAASASSLFQKAAQVRLDQH
jgi:hypothetical protein